jgi:hypothetical protein
MFGKKKQVEQPPAELPKLEQEKTQVIEAPAITQDKARLMEWLVQEYKSTYMGAVAKGTDLEQVSVDLLFAIYGELRILRMLQEK